MSTAETPPPQNTFISTTKTQTTECSICIEPYNKRTRTPIKCPYCEYTACRTCYQTYMMGETITNCMNPECKKEWTLHFLRNSFTNTFINTDLKNHREDVLFQQEVALLPATQPFVEREIERENIRKEIAEKHKEIAALSQEVEALWRNYSNVSNTTITRPANRVEFVRNCPASDCRGFLSTQWKCGICSNWTCPTCHEVKGQDRNAEHTCDPSNVATAELLAQDTRHCPKCATPIFKIDGCDQMWCTQCQTGFSWRTGRIETNVHNPHYFEWLRRTRGQQPARNDVEFQCGRELTHRMTGELERLLLAKTTVPVERTNLTIMRHNDTRYLTELEKYRHPNAQPALDKLTTIIRSILHVNAVDRARYYYNHTLDNQNLRIMYMRNQITSERFKVLVQQRHKKTHKHREIVNVIDIVVNTTTDIIYRFREYLVSSPQTECDIGMLDEIARIREYANECLMDISYTYNSVILRFTDTMRMISLSANGM